MGDESDPTLVDVAIVGGGISGIGMAARLAVRCPGRTFAMLERRADIGGTWDLFRYPGVRSDSDMYTLGYSFEPWQGDKGIAAGDEILAYLHRIVDRYDIRRHIRFGCAVRSADWDSAAARWMVTIDGPAGATTRIAARWLHMAAGYYDYDRPHEPSIPGLQDFAGTVIHPQFWPAGFDHAGKRVIVIGSGATAATIVPAMARSAAHVTMLQRTPSWYLARPARDALAALLGRFLPPRAVHAIARFRSIRLERLTFRYARRHPARVARWLTARTRRALGDAFDSAAFTPPYGPWEQRLCIVPDGDLFVALREGRADIVTGEIERVDASGIRLRTGRHIGADVIVTATGLRLVLAGKVALSFDGARLNLARRFHYKDAMFSNVPNFSAVFGYLNASWTLRAELVADYVCDVLDRMSETGADVATPVLPDGHALAVDTDMGFSSGYLKRARRIMPLSALTRPWRMGQDFLRDRAWLRTSPVEDGVLRLERAGTTQQ